MEDIIIGNLTGITNGTHIIHSPIIFTETATVGSTLTSDTAQAGGDIIGSILLLFIISYLLLQEFKLKVEEEV